MARQNKQANVCFRMVDKVCVHETVVFFNMSDALKTDQSDPHEFGETAHVNGEDANAFADLTERHQTLKQHNKWLSDLGDATARMLELQSVDRLLQHIAEELVNVSCANGAYMHMVHETGDYLQVLAADGPLSDYLLGGRRYKGIGLSAKVWETGTAQFVPNYNNHPDCVLKLDSQIQALSMPLSFAGEVLGVVFVTADIDAPLKEDLDLLKQVASIASMSIHHANQREAVSRELSRSKTLSSISAEIYQCQEWNELAMRVCPQLFDALNLSRVSLYHVNSTSDQLEAHASWIREGDSVTLSTPIHPNRISETISEWCYRNKKPAQINRAVKDSRESASIHAFREVRKIGSTLSVPIITDDAVWGVLTVSRRLAKRNFDESDVHTINTVVGQMSTALQRQNLLLEIQHQARHDSLTELPNRRAFEKHLQEILADDTNKKSKKAVLFFDLDGFKNVNDSHGHAAGDAVLKQVATRMVECKDSEIMLARLGGDEFSVVLPHLEETSDAEKCAQTFLDSFTESFHVDEHELDIGVSIGISFYPRDGVKSDDLIRHADMAMYQAKRKGRNCIVSFDHDLAKSSRVEQDREKDLRKAVSEKEFDLWYQPQVSLDSGLVTGVEALIRWQHPTQGIVAPTNFIPLAEELGLISLVGTWVLERSCQQMLDWKHHDPIPWHMGINVSAPQIMKKGFAESVLKILEAYGIDPDKLQLEVTESMLLSDLESVAGNFRLLRSHGVSIALDDFGTGYSSLTYLQQLPVDILKIDRSFISKLAPGDAMESLASTIVLLASRFGLTTVAEGVETVEQLELVKQLNCDLVQGYYFSKPVTALDLPRVICDINLAQQLPKKAA